MPTYQQNHTYKQMIEYQQNHTYKQMPRYQQMSNNYNIYNGGKKYYPTMKYDK